MDLGKVGGTPVSRMLMVAYDDLYSVEYFERRLRPYWRRNRRGAEWLLTTALQDFESLKRQSQLFDEEVNPMVARHGGRVELIDVQDAVVMLRMGGGCQGCGMADVTLRQGIEGMLAQHIPEIRGIVDITDHTSGANPYFQASKK